ncbi:MAG: hypothetical protein L0Y64_24325 [Myxococcaceae bacterium]|nr:hypothetical protein [Myxococcaceae bacterium]
MSIIAAMLTPDGCWVGHDSQATLGDDHRLVDQSKLVEVDGMVALVTGPSLTLTCARAALSGMVGGEFHPLVFAVNLREAFGAVGWEPEPDMRPPNWGVSILLTDGRELWSFDGRLAPHPHPRGEFVAAGSMEYAYGANHAVDAVRPELGPQDRLAVALAASCQYSTWCGGRQVVRLVERRGERVTSV